MGDPRQAFEQLRRALGRVRYPREVDVPALLRGEPGECLAVARHVLLDFSRPVARRVAEAGHPLLSRDAPRLAADLYRVLRDVFGMHPALSVAQFLSPGFAERKMQLLAEVARRAVGLHRGELAARRAAAREPAPDTVPGLAERLTVAERMRRKAVRDAKRDRERAAAAARARLPAPPREAPAARPSPEEAWPRTAPPPAPVVRVEEEEEYEAEEYEEEDQEEKVAPPPDAPLIHWLRGQVADTSGVPVGEEEEEEEEHSDEDESFSDHESEDDGDTPAGASAPLPGDVQRRAERAARVAAAAAALAEQAARSAPLRQQQQHLEHEHDAEVSLTYTPPETPTSHQGGAEAGLVRELLRRFDGLEERLTAGLEGLSARVSLLEGQFRFLQQRVDRRPAAAAAANDHHPPPQEQLRGGVRPAAATAPAAKPAARSRLPRVVVTELPPREPAAGTCDFIAAARRRDLAAQESLRRLGR